MGCLLELLLDIFGYWVLEALGTLVCGGAEEADRRGLLSWVFAGTGAAAMVLIGYFTMRAPAVAQGRALVMPGWPWLVAMIVLGLAVLSSVAAGVSSSRHATGPPPCTSGAARRGPLIPGQTSELISRCTDAQRLPDGSSSPPPHLRPGR